MSEALIGAIIAAATATGTTIYSADQSRKRTHEVEDAAKAQAAQQAEQQAAAQKAAEEQAAAQRAATEEQNAAVMKKRIEELNTQTGGMANTDWLQSVLVGEFPGETPDSVNKAIQAYMSTGGAGSSTTSSGSGFYTGG